MKSPALRLTVQGADGFADVPKPATLRRWIRAALGRDAELTVRFVGGIESRQLNRRHRGIDRSTNVLTFVYGSAPRVIADIVLCVPKVRLEAAARARPVREHLAHLLVHGVLHAQGFDHHQARQAVEMERREVRILANLGFDDPYRLGSSLPRAPNRASKH